MQYMQLMRKGVGIGGSVWVVIYIDNEIYIEEVEIQGLVIFLLIMQKGWIYSEYGLKDVLKFEDILMFEVKLDEVLVKV